MLQVGGLSLWPFLNSSLRLLTLNNELKQRPFLLEARRFTNYFAYEGPPPSPYTSYPQGSLSPWSLGLSTVHSSPSATILFFRFAHSKPPVVHYVAENSINSFEKCVHFTSEWNFNLRAKRRNRSHRFHQHSVVVYNLYVLIYDPLSVKSKKKKKNSKKENLKKKKKIENVKRVEEKRNEIMNTLCDSPSIFSSR